MIPSLPTGAFSSVDMLTSIWLPTHDTLHLLDSRRALERVGICLSDMKRDDRLKSVGCVLRETFFFTIFYGFFIIIVNSGGVHIG